MVIILFSPLLSDPLEFGVRGVGLKNKLELKDTKLKRDLDWCMTCKTMSKDGLVRFSTRGVH
jgi:hypothetical protein